MWLNPKHEDRLDRLMEQLRLAPAATADLIANVIADSLHTPAGAEQDRKGCVGSIS